MTAKELNRFDRIALLYDWLTGLVFFKAVRKAQANNLNLIPDSALVLVLGGGTGRWLKGLIRHNTTCQVYYVEASSKMLDQAKENLGNSDRIHFIHGTEMDIPVAQFDIVITHFFLDMFEESQLVKLIDQIRNVLKSEGLWLVSDFVDQKYWHKYFLTVMYLFFRAINTIDCRSLPRWDSILRSNSFRVENSTFFYGHFIQSQVYAKDQPS